LRKYNGPYCAKHRGVAFMKKIIFLDIDGTLMETSGYIPPSAVAACREARKRGHLLYVCSGRNLAEIGDEILSIGFDGIASSGGAHVEIGGRVIFDTTMPPETVKQIAAFLESCKCGFALEKNEAILSNAHYVSFWEAIIDRLDAKEKTSSFIPHLLELIKSTPLPENCDDSYYKGVNKIVFAGSGSVSFAAVKRAFGGECEIFHSSFHYYGEEGGEIGPLGVHKGLALKKVAEHHGVSLADTVAFGDSDNDRPMFECAGVGVAMGNARDSLKAMAHIVTTSLVDDGIFNGFNKLGLI